MGNSVKIVHHDIFVSFSLLLFFNLEPDSFVQRENLYPRTTYMIQRCHIRLYLQPSFLIGRRRLSSPPVSRRVG